MPQVKIGPHFFAKEFNDYADWHWAYIREAAQNCFDAPGSTLMAVAITPGTITFENNGRPMTEDVLVNKLLALGESGKNFEGSVGGFGKAKVLLYMAHKSYTIRTGTMEVKGCGGDYEITRDLPYFHGTKSAVVTDGDHSQRLMVAVRDFARYCQWGGSLTLNGVTLATSLAKGSRRRDMGFGVVYTNKSFENKLVVRIGGIPMFTDYVGHDRCVVVELAGNSAQTLTANRDGLVRPYSSQLQALITEIAIDKRSALRDKGEAGPSYSTFGHKRLKHEKVQEFKATPQQGGMLHEMVLAGAAAAKFVDGGSCEGVAIGAVPEFEPVVNEAGDRQEAYAPAFGSVEPSPVRRVSSLSEFFVVKNESGMKVPACYLPDSYEFSQYSRRLIRIWGRLMLTLHRLFDHEAEFGLGFIFTESAEAEFEDRDFGKMYYLNPAEVVEQSSGSRSFKKRFKLTERNRLISIATHEFVHGLGFGYHGEDYANKLTDMMAVVMDNRAKFNWCFA